MTVTAKYKFPGDLQIVLVVVLLTILFVLVPPLDETPLRVVLGLVMVLFLLGYSLISALFPGKKDLDGIERIALSFGLSIAVAPLIGLALNYTPFGIRQVPSLIALSVFTIVCTIAAYIRRSGLGEKERFALSFRYRPELPKKRIDRILTIVLVLSILTSLSALVYVIVTPKQGEKFTEFYILGPGAMADDYPTSLSVGQEGTVIMGVVNHEYEPIDYTLCVVLNNRSLDQIPIRIGHNETFSENFTFSPVENGTGKLEFLLYKADTGEHEPYRSLHLWVEVSN